MHTHTYTLTHPQQTQEDSSTDDENLLDFSVLFEMESLHKALLNIKLVVHAKTRALQVTGSSH